MFKALKSLNFFCKPFFNYIRQLLNSKNFSISCFFMEFTYLCGFVRGMYTKSFWP